MKQNTVDKSQRDLQTIMGTYTFLNVTNDDIDQYNQSIIDL